MVATTALVSRSRKGFVSLRFFPPKEGNTAPSSVVVEIKEEIADGLIEQLEALKKLRQR